jgi:hypothetical protein
MPDFLSFGIKDIHFAHIVKQSRPFYDASENGSVPWGLFLQIPPLCGFGCMA